MSSAPTRQKLAEDRPGSSSTSTSSAGRGRGRPKKATASETAEGNATTARTPGKPRESRSEGGTKAAADEQTTSDGRKKTPKSYPAYPQEQVQTDSPGKPSPDRDHKSTAKSRQSHTSAQKEEQLRLGYAVSLDTAEKGARPRDEQLDGKTATSQQSKSHEKHKGDRQKKPGDKQLASGQAKDSTDDKSPGKKSADEPVEQQPASVRRTSMKMPDQSPAQTHSGRVQRKLGNHSHAQRQKPCYQETLVGLHRRLGLLTVSRKDISCRADVVNDLLKDLLDHLNSRACEGGSRWGHINSGSYYDHTKVSKPDEFDVMLTYSMRVKAVYAPQQKPGPENLFCKLEAIDSVYQSNPLDCFYPDKADGKMYACPKAFMDNFRKHCEDFFKKYRAPRSTKVEIKDFDDLSPAMTLDIDKGGQIKFALDVVPAISLKEWPKPASRWQSRWLPKAEVERIKAEGGQCPNEFPCAVAKIYSKESSKPMGECRLWRISFSPIEKRIFLHADGSHKGPHDDKSVRKGVLRLLKDNATQLKDKAKESTTSATAQNKSHDFSSHFLKNIMLQLYDDLPDWNEDDLLDRYLDGLDRVALCLSERNIPHYFIENVNLLDLTPLRKKQLEHYEEGFRRLADKVLSDAGLSSHS